MITTEIPTWEDPPAMPKSNYRASGSVRRPTADLRWPYWNPRDIAD